MSTTIFKILPLCAALALTGCVNLAPDHERPAAPVEQAWPTGEAYDAASVRSEALPEWQAFFTDERLRKVIALALKENRALRVSARMFHEEVQDVEKEIRRCIQGEA